MCLFVLRLALFESRLRPLVLRLRGLQACLRKPQLRIRLFQCFRLRDFRGPCTVHLIDGDELLCQKRLETVQVVAGVGPLCFCPAHPLLRIGHIRPRLFDGRRPACHVGFGTRNIRFGNGDAAYQCIDSSLLVSDLPFEGGLLRKSPLERVLIRSLVNLV